MHVFFYDLGDEEIKNAIRMYCVWCLNCQALSVGSMPRSVWFKVGVFIFKIKGSRNHKKLMNIAPRTSDQHGSKELANQHHRCSILAQKRASILFPKRNYSLVVAGADLL